MKLKTVLYTLTSAAILSAISMQAHAIEGYYLQIGAGGTFAEDTPIRGGTVDNDLDFNWGWAASSSFGYQHSNGIRTELEAAYRDTDIDSISFASPGQGDVRVSTLMANILFDFDIMEDSTVMPYIGGGAGIAYVDFDDVRPLGVTTNQSVDEADISPALQAIIGMNYALSPATDLYANYHFMSVLSPDFTTSSQVDVKADYDSSNLLVGVRFALGGDDNAAEIASGNIPSAPLSPISRTYLVFFDLNQHTLSKEAKAILQDAASDAQAGNAVAVEVRGHADRTGSSAYNMRLSQKRADTVRTYLGSRGIPHSRIEAKAMGENSPLIPTGDGISEPRNRRAEVVYVIDMQR